MGGLSLEELSGKLGNKITNGANVWTIENVAVKNGIGFVSNFPVSYNGNNKVFGWIEVDKDKQLFKRIKFKEGSCKFKFRKFWKTFTGNIKISYWYYDEKAVCIEMPASNYY